jgi:GNAT superfamily N-acetyltransferase
VSYRAPAPIDKSHVADGFDCGKEALNEWLQKHALAAHNASAARVFVTTQEDANIVGYYALAAGDVEPSDATDRLAKGQPVHRAIPVALLARLAVDRHHQGAGLGRSLLRDALQRAIEAADRIGLRAIVVHAKDDEARAWYEKHGFESSPTDPLHLILLMKDVRATVGDST